MTKLLEQMTGRELVQLQKNVQMAVRSGAGDINELIHRHFNELISRYLGNRGRNKAGISSPLMEKYLAELQEAKAVLTEEANKVFFFYRKQADVARIEFPALDLIVQEGMSRKGIPYTFAHINGENILTVQVVNEHFFKFPVTMENAERLIGLIRYFINRPECAVREWADIRCYRSYTLASSWNKVASGGNK